jgi:hypothetical protein
MGYGLSKQWQGIIYESVVEVTALAYGWRCQNGEVDVVDDGSVAKMSGGDVVVEPSLSSRNTLGNGNRNSNSQRTKRVKIVGGGSG